MPKIPKYEKQVNFSGDSRPALSSGSSEVPSKIMSEAGRQLQALGQKVNEIDKFRQETAATIKLQSELNDLQIRYNEEPDLDKKKEYWGQIDSVVNNSINSISDYEARLSFERRAKLVGDSTLFSMKNEHRGMLIKEAKDGLDISRIQAEESAKTNDETGIRVSRINYDNAINKATELGVITQEEAAYRKGAIGKVAELNQLYFRANEDPELAIKLANESTTLSLQEKSGVIKQAKYKIKERSDIMDLQVTYNQIRELAVLPKELDMVKIDAMEAANIIDKDISNNLRARKLEGVASEPVEDRGFEFDRLMSQKIKLFKFNSEGKVEGQKKWSWGGKANSSKMFMIDVLRSYSNGDLTSSSYGKLVSDVESLIRQEGDVSALSAMASYDQLQKLAVTDNPLTMRLVVPQLFEQIREDIHKMTPQQAVDYSKEFFNKYKGLPEGKSVEEVAETTPRLEVGTTFQGGKIKAVRSK